LSKRVLLLPIAVIVVGIAFLVGLRIYLDDWSERPLPLTKETLFVVHPATPFSKVADTLHQLDVVNSWLFSQYAQQLGAQTSVQMGEYRVSPGDTARTLLDRLTAGDVVVHRLLIVEGSTVAALLGQLAADERIEFDISGIPRTSLMKRLGLGAGDPEGRFFPDTYLFKRGAKASSLLRRAEHKMAAVLTEAWAKRQPDLPLEGREQALILASIIEKETGLAEDRPRVAGVFVRRLHKGMRLQSDPTVIYGLGDAFDGDLTREDLATDNEYNTYRRHGLPPTPIALPGRASIEAALHPAEGDALYFVARGDGSSQFSDNLDDHNEAVRLYQRR